MLTDLIVPALEMMMRQFAFFRSASFQLTWHFLQFLLTNVATAAVAATTAQAQESTSNFPIQTIEVTGSAPERDVMAVFSTILTRDDIARSGAQSTAELIQSLPAMQGYTNAAASVGGSGGGVETTSLHSFGSQNTLVLLDGSYGSGSAVNLASIPLAAIERIEITTDGSSTRYGTGAMGGVVNIILRKNSLGGEVQFSVERPQESGGGSTRVSISQGFGDVDQDGYNLLLAFSHDQQAELKATQREFGRTGVIPFSLNGTRYLFTDLSGNTAPASVTVNQANGTTTQFSPYLLANSSCNPGTYKVGLTCEYDYASSTELLPRSQRNSLFTTWNSKLGGGANLFGELVLSQLDVTSQIAAPSRSLGFSLNDPLGQAYVSSYLAQLGINPNNVTSLTLNSRIPDAGTRIDDFHIIAKHLVLGVEGKNREWNYQASLMHSENSENDNVNGGYLDLNALTAIASGGGYNPFTLPGNYAAVLAPAILHQSVDTTHSRLDNANAKVSGDLWRLPGGAVRLDLGAEIFRQGYADNPSAILQGPNALQPNFTDGIVGNNNTALPYNTTRINWAGFGQLQLPLSKQLELGAAARYDHYDAARSSDNFDINGNPTGPAIEGNTFAKATYRLALKFQASDALTLQASYGTGFNAPMLTTITAPLTLSGTTNAQYPCPVGVNDARAIGCQGMARYDVLSGGNPNTGSNGLKGEESTQSMIGLRFNPNKQISLAFSLWQGTLTNSFAVLQEQTAFNNPIGYSNLFKLIYDPYAGQRVIAFEEVPVNLGSGSARGIDWEHTFKANSALGKLNLSWSGSYMIKLEQTYPGGVSQSDIGKFGADQAVVFRLKSRLMLSQQESEQVTNSITINYQSGYHDQTYVAEDGVISLANPDGSLGPYVALNKHEVASYTTFDWQTLVAPNQRCRLRFGIKNLFDRAPPFSLVTAGDGLQVGYDGRYANPLGRQFYLQSTYQF